MSALPQKAKKATAATATSVPISGAEPTIWAESSPEADPTTATVRIAEAT